MACDLFGMQCLAAAHIMGLYVPLFFNRDSKKRGENGFYLEKHANFALRMCNEAYSPIVINQKNAVL